MDLPLPEEVQGQLDGFAALLGSLEAKLHPFLGRDGAAKLAQLPPLERAQAHLAVAHATAALLELYLKASGVDPEDHESAKQQERLKLYAKKVRKAASEAELRRSRRSLEVNVAAVNRFIAAAVPDLSAEQKAALRQAGQAAGKGAAGAAGSGGGSSSAPASGKRKQPSGDGAAGRRGAAGAGDAAEAAAAFLEGLQPAGTGEEAAGVGKQGKKQKSKTGKGHAE